MTEIADSASYRNLPLSMGRSNSERFIKRGSSAPAQQKRRNSEAYPRRAKTQRPKWSAAKVFGMRKKKEQTLVRRRILEGGFWTRFARRFVKDEVPVECLGELGVTASVLYAKDIPDTTEYFAVTNQIYGAPTKSEKNVVCQGDSFEIRVVGMQVAKWDTLIPAISGNEVVLYSIEKDEERSYIKPPYIHFDYERDGNKESTKANEYIPIPDSKSYVAGFKAPKCDEETYIDDNGVQKKTKHRYKTKVKNHVSVKFKLIEIDSPNESVRHALNGLDDLDGMMSGFSSSVPFLGLVAPSIGITNMVTSKVLEKYSSPDFIMSIDMSFQLADRKRAEKGTLAPAKYLKYGYYFFLSDPIDAKLYASVRSPEHVQLMLHQDPEYLKKMKKKRKKSNPILDREYFPLTDANYIVVRVSEPTGASDGRHRYQYLEDAHKLETIFKNSRRGDESPGTTRRKIVKLGKSLGVFDSDSESECGCDKCKRHSDLPLHPHPSPNPWEAYEQEPLDPSESRLSTIEGSSTNPKSGRQTLPYQTSAPSASFLDSEMSTGHGVSSIAESSGRKSFLRSRRRNRKNRKNSARSDSGPMASVEYETSSSSSVRENVDRIITSYKDASSSTTSDLRAPSSDTSSHQSKMVQVGQGRSTKRTCSSKASSSTYPVVEKDVDAIVPNKKNNLKFSKNHSKKNDVIDTNKSDSSDGGGDGVYKRKRDDFIRRSRR